MKQVFESPDADAVILRSGSRVWSNRACYEAGVQIPWCRCCYSLIDATNAFNTTNHENALRNIQHLCPPIAKVLINTYREGAPLYIDGETLVSQEGTTQGDLLAMALYGIAVIPLICRLWMNKCNKCGLQMMQQQEPNSIHYKIGGTSCGSSAPTMAISPMSPKPSW